MRALVTGGAGFIGSALVDALIAQGWEVTVVDDLSRGRREHVDRRAELAVLDVADPALDAVVERAAPDVVFHQAAQIDVRRSLEEPLLDTRVNVLGTVNLLEACARRRVARVVLASSGGAVYGETDVLPTAETHPASPASVYGAAKLAGEVYGFTYARLHPLDFVALRYANVYGPRQDSHGEAGVVAIFCERLLTGRETVIYGDGRQTRDFVHVDDVVRANLLAAGAANGVGSCNIGTGRETTIEDIHRRLAALCGSDRAPRHEPGRPGEQRRSCVDIGLAERRLGWRPEVGLDEGLAGTLEYFRATCSGR